MRLSSYSLFIVLCAFRPVDARTIENEPVLRGLREGHPRLIALDRDVARIRKNVASDALARSWLDHLRQEGTRLIQAPPVEYKLIGPRLLSQSRACLDRIYTLCLLYRLEGDRRFAERAKMELLAAAGFKDWNPSHFLDTAEMAHAFGIGYDWLYDFLGEDRAAIRTALVEKGLKPGAEFYKANRSWVRAIHNWNQVCNGGLSIGALAIADEEPELAEFIVSSALKSIPLAVNSYAPDGGWAEGPGYWHYATRYTVYFFAALESALGRDFGLPAMPGFPVTGDFRIHSIGPTRRSFNYADASDRAEGTHEMFWLAQKFDRPLYAWHQRQHQERPHALDLVWFDARGGSPKRAGYLLDALFRGINVAFFRSDWEDPNALFVGFKGGDNKANHSHLDLGDFVLDALGKRWAVDLAGDDYNLPEYFGKKRWTYYRLRTEGQNTLQIDGGNQDPSARAPIIAYHSSGERAFAVADLSAAYKTATRVWRGVALLGRERVLVQDELEAENPTELVWNMHTPAEISLDGASATLTQGEARLRARILSPEGAYFDIRSATPPPPENPNTGIRKLIVRFPEKLKSVRLAVLLELGALSQAAPPIEPLNAWVELGPLK